MTLSKQYSAAEYAKGKELSERQIHAIQFVIDHGSITNAQYQKVAEVSERTVTRELNDLKQKEILVAEGKRGRGIFYRIKTP